MHNTPSLLVLSNFHSEPRKCHLLLNINIYEVFLINSDFYKVQFQANMYAEVEIKDNNNNP